MSSMTRAQRTTLWLVVNVCGALAYLYFASWVWPPPELRGMPEGHAAGDAFVWGLGALPMFLTCALIDAGVLVWSAFGYARDGAWRFAWWAWSIPALWLVAFAIDRYHG